MRGCYWIAAPSARVGLVMYTLPGHQPHMGKCYELQMRPLQQYCLVDQPEAMHELVRISLR